MNGRNLARRLGWRTLSAAVLVTLVVLSVAGLGHGAGPGPRTGTHPHATKSITVTVGSGFTFAPSNFRVEPGDTVNLAFVQSDGTPHSFLIVAEPNYNFPSGAGTSTLLTYFTQHPPLVNLSVDATAGTVTKSFTAPALGIYEFVCTQSGHFAAGMFGYMGSGEDPPNSSPPYDGPGAIVFFIGGGIAGLVILAIVLAFVIGRRRGSHDEMPPERLGYPEPPRQPPKSS